MHFIKVLTLHIALCYMDFTLSLILASSVEKLGFSTSNILYCKMKLEKEIQLWGILNGNNN